MIDDITARLDRAYRASSLRKTVELAEGDLSRETGCEVMILWSVEDGHVKVSGIRRIKAPDILWK